jgi:hypothetical protein
VSIGVLLALVVAIVVIITINIIVVRVSLRASRRRRLAEAQEMKLTEAQVMNQPDRRKGGGLGSILLLAGLTLVFSYWGLSAFWQQHSGIAAPVYLVHCHGTRSGSECDGVWRQADGTEKTVTIDVRRGWEGDTVDAHIHGDRAYGNSLFHVIHPLAWACVSLACLIVVVFAYRKSKR